MKKIDAYQSDPSYEVNRISDRALSIHIQDTKLGIHAGRTAAADLGRVLSRINQNEDFLIITPFRSERSFPQNKAHFFQLPNDLRVRTSNPKIGGYWLIGHWKECSYSGLAGVQTTQHCEAIGCHIIDALEYSWLFIKPAEISSDLWKGSAIEIARLYDQDAFVIHIGGSSYLCGIDGAEWERLSAKGSVEKACEALAWLRANCPSFGYADVLKFRAHGGVSPIAFSPLGHIGFHDSSYYLSSTNPECSSPEQARIQFFVAEPHNNSSKALFYYANIYRADKFADSTPNPFFY
ncbi:MAG: hypothetical protein HHJ09_00620 [Glaciimonas sp.]|nr:hypothetical protein [Glaciimonas sp.]